MTRLLLVISSVILAVTVNSANGSALHEKILKNTKIQFVTSDQMKDLLKENPNAIELQRKVKILDDKETKDPAIFAPRFTINYYIGQHTPLDYRVAHDSDGYSWAELRDVKMTLQYPSQGIGKFVTFVDIYVSQSSNSGRAFMTAGGIGYRYITIVVEADRTYYLEYDASIYGQD